MTMGLSMALHEDSVMDPRIGQVVNHDLAEYHVAANADVGDIEAHWLDEHDPYVNAMGCKGIGEIGIIGTAAAVSTPSGTPPASGCGTCRSRWTSCSPPFPEPPGSTSTSTRRTRRGRVPGPAVPATPIRAWRRRCSATQSTPAR